MALKAFVLNTYFRVFYISAYLICICVIYLFVLKTCQHERRSARKPVSTYLENKTFFIARDNKKVIYKSLIQKPEQYRVFLLTALQLENHLDVCIHLIVQGYSLREIKLLALKFSQFCVINDVSEAFRC